MAMTYKIWAGLVLALVMGLVAITPALAQDQACASPAFFIRGLEVEEEAASGDQARRQATQHAIAEAWQLLIDRLVLADQDASVLDEVVASDMLEFTSIVAETVLSKRYIGTLDFCFEREAVRRVFNQYRIQHAELTSEQLLLLPVFITASGRPYLWREPNPWKGEMLRILPDHNGLLDLHVPSGLALARSVSAEAVATGDQKTLARMAKADDVPMVIVTSARIVRNAFGGSGPLTPFGGGGQRSADQFDVVVSATLYDQEGNRISTIQTSRLPLAEEASDQFAYLARDIIDKIENVWRRANRVDFTDDNLIRLTLTPGSMQDWVATLEMLAALPPVEGYEVRQLSAAAGVVDLVLVGSRDAFDYALGQAGFQLTANDDAFVGGFVLTRVQ